MADVTIVGAGLAGCEAAWQAAQRGLPRAACTMRPASRTPAHVTDHFAELVCSNSLGAVRLDRALGLLKEELRRLGSLIIACADRHALPAGGALAVDRERFAQAVTEAVTGHPLIDVLRSEVKDIPPGVTILASGPLTSHRLGARIGELAGQSQLYFYDALAPIVALESIAMPPAWRQSRYDRDSGQSEGDYINCPLNRDAVRGVCGGGARRRAHRAASLRAARTSASSRAACPIEVMAGRERASAGLRPDAAGRPARPAHRAAALRRGAAAPGQPGGQRSTTWSASRPT